ncbi:ultraviolet-B receptor UVR8 [Cimex lectularius]|uniref:Uncharacterized protein n=1 Tax=Cimex lectularius TaxID=79782 RepID=A0A8I6RAK3_CIMLE|nr:ultraviolet-B receptor UVR8 [Cimex lectularius]
MAMLFVCGFNQFEQLNCLIEKETSGSNKEDNVVTKLIRSPCQDIRDVYVTWSNVLVVRRNGVTINGFLDGVLVKSKSVNPPFVEPVIQASGTRSRWIFVSEKGECWEYCSGKWRLLNYLFPPPGTNEEESISGSIADSTGTEQDGTMPGQIASSSVEKLDKSAYRLKVMKVVCGSTLTVGLTTDGLVYTLPVLMKFPVGTPPIKDIACGLEHAVALSEDGRVFTWGCGTRGQLGLGNLENCKQPTEVEALTGLKVSCISAGGWHSAAVTADGDVYTWGWNKEGQLGHPCINSDSWEGKVGVLAEPRAVDWPQGINVTVNSVSCGTTHTVSILDNGEAWGCGRNQWGQLGSEKYQFTDKMTKLDMPDAVIATKIHCAAWNTIIFAKHAETKSASAQ